MSGGTYIQGVNEASEGQVYSGYTGKSDTFTLTGGPWIDGPVAAFKSDTPKDQCKFSGNPKIADRGLWGGDPTIWDMVTTGVSGIEFPELYPTVFEPFATNYVTEVKPYYDRDLDQYINTFENVRIMANSNPVIAADATINGVIYIESPNKVTFTAGCQINGVIVTEDGSPYDLKNCKLKFSGGFNLSGVSSLPSDSKWDALRQLTGTSIIAPGFEVEMTGGATAAGGWVACEELRLTGGTVLSVKGGVMVYGDNVTSLTGGAAIRVDKDGVDEEVPSGFLSELVMSVTGGTYEEY